MSETSAAPMAESVRPDALSIVLFGMPAAGKSSLLGALAQAAEAQEHLLSGHLEDLSHGLAELRRRLYDEAPRRTAEEVVPYPVDFEPLRNGAGPSRKHLDAVFIDCDGRVANDLLVRRRALDENSPEGTLAREVVDADTLLLVVDASAPTSQLDADFAEFDRFLREMELGRGQRAEVAGLPVFLVLTKCDLLAQPGDTAGTWMERIEERKREVDARFRDFLTRRSHEEGVPAFGGIHLNLWATAVKRPGLAGSPPRDREPYGVAELFRQCLEEAAAFRDRQRRSRRRLVWTVGGAAGALALMVSLGVGLVLWPEPRHSPLETQAIHLLSEDLLRGPKKQVKERLADFEQLAHDRDFDTLTSDQREQVHDRIRELNAYLAYWDGLDQVSPAAARSAKDLEETEKRLGPLPEQWAKTRAAQDREDRVRAIAALSKALDTVRDWYRDYTPQAVRLAGWPKGLSPDAWLDQVKELFEAEKTRTWSAETPIPGSPLPLTYGTTVLRYEEVVGDQSRWETDRKHLQRVLAVVSALGLVEPGPDRPPVLVIPRSFTLAQANQRWNELRAAYGPDFKTLFTLAGLPEKVEADVKEKVGTSSFRDARKTGYYDHLLEPGRKAVLERLQQAGTGNQETAERWERVRTWLHDNPAELREWRQLATLMARLYDPKAPDPVDALEDFLQRKVFQVEVQQLLLVIPDRLKVRPAPKAALKIYQTSPSGESLPGLELVPTDQVRTDKEHGLWIYSFRPTGTKRLEFEPGNIVRAELALDDEKQLTWWRSRSARYEIEALRREPRLHRAGEDAGKGSLEKDIRLLPEPSDGIPIVPDLMPVVNLR